MGPAKWALTPWVTEVLTATSVPPIDIAMTQILQSLKDTQHRALLLQAQAGAVRRQQHGLKDPMQHLQNQLKRLQDMQRWGSASLGRLDILLTNPCVLPDPFLCASSHDIRAVRAGSFIILGTWIYGANWMSTTLAFEKQANTQNKAPPCWS